MLRRGSNTFLLITAGVLGFLYIIGLQMSVRNQRGVRVGGTDKKIFKNLRTVQEKPQELDAKSEESLEISRIRMKQRRDLLLATCEKYERNFSTSSEVTFVKNPYLKTSLFFSDKYKMLFCIIPKCASTNLAKFIVAADHLDPRETDPSKIGGNYAAALLRKKRSARHAHNIEEIVKRMDTYSKFILVREPFSRLLSAFRNKIEGNTRGDSYAKLAQRIHQKYGSAKGQSKVTLDEFISYVSSPENRAQYDQHWNFYSKLCSPCSIKYDYIVHMETLSDDMNYVIKTEGMKNISMPPSYDSFTDNEKVKKYYGAASPKLVNDLYHAYKIDYELFGFPPPPQF